MDSQAAQPDANAAEPDGPDMLELGRKSSARRPLRRALSVAFAVFVFAGLEAHAEEQGLWEREKLTGDWGGTRTWLKEQKGIDISVNYIGETFSLLSGGLRRGTAYEGRLDVAVEADLEKLLGWTGGKFYGRAFQIHKGGRNALDLVGSIADPSNIDALPTTRLFTLWYQQEFGKLASLRVGQLAADDEFLTSTSAGYLINGTFGWATIMGANLPSGGPAYPLATPGARLQVNANDNVSLLAAVFSGDPAGPNCFDDPQRCNRYGTTFSFSGGAFWLGELQYAANQEKDSKGLAVAYKLGVWHHTGNFADQRFGLDPTLGVVSLAATPTPDPLLRRGDWGVYGVIDQTLYRSETTSVSFFTRAGIAQPDNRNLVSWYFDGGAAVKGFIPGRPDDVLVGAIAHSRISSTASALDIDTLALNGRPYPIRTSETVFELSYLAQVAPWWTIQPDLQYIVHPGGNVPDPDNPARTVGNAFLVGVRSTMAF
jgi:porin